MDLRADIVSGQSIAGINLGANVDTVLSDLQGDNIPFSESTFENSGGSFRQFSIADGKASLVADALNRVIRISCRSGYLGKCKRTLQPGMSVEAICRNSSKQLIIHGVVILDNDFGVGFNIPDVYEGNHYDDIDYITQLPATMILDELHVMDPEWWR